MQDPSRGATIPRVTPSQTIPEVPPVRWTTRVLLPLLLAPVFGGLVYLVDRSVYDAIRALNPGGDLRREIETLGQFGGFASMLVAFLLIALLDPRRVRRLLDWGFAVLLGTLVFNAMKILIGRGRPVLDDPALFLGPTGEHTNAKGEVITALADAQLRAMPSSHTTHAVIAAVAIAFMYPRLRVMVWAWAALVGLSRILLGAHWPSDVVVGALLAFPLAHVVVTRSWGVRGLDWVWCTLIDRKATPAYPAVVEREHLP